MRINWICYTKSESNYTRKLLNKCLKPVFEYKITFWISVLVLWIHKHYCVFKLLVWYFRIKAFWYTKIIKLHFPTYIFDTGILNDNFSRTSLCSILSLPFQENKDRQRKVKKKYLISISDRKKTSVVDPDPPTKARILVHITLNIYLTFLKRKQ